MVTVLGPLFRCRRVAAPVVMRSRAHHGGIVVRVVRGEVSTLTKFFYRNIKLLMRVLRVLRAARGRA